MYWKEGAVCRWEAGQTRPIVRGEEIFIPGMHNVENFMAAFAATQGLVSDACCRQVARSFRGVPHRLEILRTLRGVTYCNDSIASSPTRTIAGLRALKQKPILIAGGYDKHLAFDELGDEICRRVKSLYLTGDTAGKIRDAVTASGLYDPRRLPIHMEEDFRQAVLAAAASAREGDMVLLSPALRLLCTFQEFCPAGRYVPPDRDGIGVTDMDLKEKIVALAEASGPSGFEGGAPGGGGGAAAPVCGRAAHRWDGQPDRPAPGRPAGGAHGDAGRPPGRDRPDRHRA